MFEMMEGLWIRHFFEAIDRKIPDRRDMAQGGEIELVTVMAIESNLQIVTEPLGKRIDLSEQFWRIDWL